MNMVNKYARDVSHLKTLDPYRLQELYRMHPCAEHVVKKMLCAGERSGGKSLDKDIQDCIDTLVRWQEMREEDADIESAATQKWWAMLDDHYRWVAIDACGSVYAYAQKPYIVDPKSKGWTGSGTKIGLVMVGDWRKSLQERPQ